LAVAAGFVMATFVSQCFEFGNGSLLGGMNAAFRYVAFLPIGFGLIVLAGLSGAVAVLIGRMVGVAAAGVAACLILAGSTVASAISSKPEMRFRRMVWAGAPDSIQILKHDRAVSFSDGITYSFIVVTDSEFAKRWIHDCRLERAPQHGNEMSLLMAYFEEVDRQADASIYRGTGVVVALLALQDRAWVVCRPRGLP
jgi:hypothetical protein